MPTPRVRTAALFVATGCGAALVGALAVVVAGVFGYRAYVAPPAPQAVVRPEVKPPPEPPREQPKAVPAPVKELPKKADPPAKKPPEKRPPPEVKKKPPPPDPQVVADALVRQLNTYRKVAGLGLVRLDPELSRGCTAHARYVALNLPAGPPDAAFLLGEEPGKPGYSDEGKRAAGVAVVSIGDARTFVDTSMARLAGRLPLLQVETRTIGLGLEPLDDGRWAVVLDAARGTGEPTVLYPPPGQADVPLTFAGGPELPEPGATAGFPVTITFPPARRVTDVRAELLDAAGKPVDVWLSTPEKPALPNRQRNTVALIAKAGLNAAAVYRVRVAAKVDGEPWSKEWTFTTEDDADRKGLWAGQALAKINGYRKAAGQPPVVLDDALSRGCRAHARYLALNLGQSATAGLGAHDEDLSLPGASEEGRAAGKASDIAIGDHDPLAGIDGWMATLYHRVPLLEPHLKSVGYGCARSKRLGWVVVVNIAAGRERGPRPVPVFYPAPDQRGVPLHFPIGGEEPNPIPDDNTGKAGYPITASFPQNNPLRASSGTLTDAAGRDVPAWFSSPELPANAKFVKHQGTTVCLIPKAPLRPNATYEVVLRGRLGDQPWEKAWKFTTGGAGADPAASARQVLARLNDFRAAVGLPAVVLDPALANGCQAHAEYLVRNTQAIRKRKLSANDEEPSLPGFTPEGRQAARQSDVLAQAREPAAQVDDLMGTFLRRVYLLDPQLRSVGFGCAQEVGRGWYCVFNLIGGRGGERVVLYPAPDQEAVPCAGTDRLPGRDGPAGFPISVTFPPQAKVLAARGTLTDADGKAIEAHLSTPEDPFDASLGPRQGNAACLHPRAPLRPGQTYRVTFSAVVNGQQWRQSWEFTTE